MTQQTGQYRVTLAITAPGQDSIYSTTVSAPEPYAAYRLVLNEHYVSKCAALGWRVTLVNVSATPTRQTCCH